MAFVLADRVKETTLASGTGAFALSGAQYGYRSFASTMNNGDTAPYTCEDTITGAWETGLGTYTAASNALTRTTVYASSNGNALVVFAANSKNLFIDLTATQAIAAGNIASNAVTGFNSRKGAVTLSIGDVTGALGYMPVNKAGDTMTGALAMGANALTGSAVAITGGTVDGTVVGGVTPAAATVTQLGFGTATYAYNGVTVATTALPLNTSQVFTGQPTTFSGGLPAGNLFVIRDIIDASVAGGNFIGVGIKQTSGGNGSNGGSHSAFRSQQLSNGYVSNTVPQLGQTAGYRGCAVDSWHGMACNMGGTGAFTGGSPSNGWVGATKAINPYAYLVTTNFNGAASFLDRVWGCELDVLMPSGTSAFIKNALAINLSGPSTAAHGGDVSKGYGDDAAIVVSSNGAGDFDDVYAINPMSGQQTTGATTAAQGILFNWRATQWPNTIPAPLAFRGIDLTQGTVTDQAFATKGFGVDGAGNVVAKSLSGFGTIASITPSGGRGFTAVPLLTIPAPPGGGTAATAVVASMKVSTAEVAVAQFTTTNTAPITSGKLIGIQGFPGTSTAATFVSNAVWGAGVGINNTITAATSLQLTTSGNVDSVQGVPGTAVSATTTSGSAVVVVTSAAGIFGGQVVTGPGIASSTTVLSISGTSITLTANATATSVGTVTLTFTNNLLFANMGGSGYTNGDTVTLAGGYTAVISTGTNGVIQSFAINAGPGTPTNTIPANPVAVTGGVSGSGAFAMVYWTVNAITTTANTGLYDIAPNITYSNATGGTGLRFQVALASRPSLSIAGGGLVNTSVATGLTAVGTNQATAFAITSDVSVFTTVAPGTGGELPGSVVGSVKKVYNRGANALLVYPPSGSQIEAAGTNVAVSLAVGAQAIFTCVSATEWYQG